MTATSRVLLVMGLLAVIGLTLPSTLRAGELVTNGNFSAGSTGWFTTQTDDNFPWTFDYNGSYYYASTGCVGSTCITGTVGEQANLFQTLTTVVGDSYTLSFYYSPGPGTPTELQALFGGAVVEDLVDIGDSSPILYTVSGLVATSTLTELEFLGRQDPSYDTLTDVSVTNSASTTPEPASLLLFGTGLLAIAFITRKQLAH